MSSGLFSKSACRVAAGAYLAMCLQITKIYLHYFAIMTDFSWLLNLQIYCPPLPTYLGSWALVNTVLDKYFHWSFVSVTVLVGDHWQGWFPLTGSPWKPPCCASYLCRTPTNLSWHESPNLSTVPVMSLTSIFVFFRFLLCVCVCLASNHLSLLTREHTNPRNLPCLFSKSVLVKGWALSFSSSAVRLILLGTSLEALKDKS